MKKRGVQENQLISNESHNLYTTLFDLAQVGYVILDDKGCIQVANLTIAEKLGIERSGLIGRPFVTFVERSDVGKFQSHLQQCRHANDKVKTEVGLLVKNGALTYVQLVSTAVQNDQPQTFKYITAITDINKHKWLEETLRESEEFYKTLVENAEDFIYIIDKHLCVKYVNNFAARPFGFKPKEMIGKSLEELFPPNLFNRLKQNLQMVFESRKSNFVDNKIKFPDQEVWLDTRLIPIKNKNGEVKCVLGIGRDITKHKLVEMSLHESEERFKKLTEASFEGIAIHDKGKILEANQNFAKMFGYELNDVIGMHALDFTAQESRDLVLKNIVSGYEKPYEVVGLRKDGSTFQVEVRGKAISYQGRVVRVTALRDITERKKAEKALEESVKRFQFLVESINIGIGQVDDNQIVTHVNDKMCRMIGFNKSELIGQPCTNFIGEINQERFQNLLDLRKKGIEQSYELKLKRKDGTKISVLISPRALFDEYGNYTGTLAVCTDITERKRAEEKVKAALKEKELLLKEIHHRVKNNLQVITSLIDFHAQYIKNNNKELELCMKCQNRVKSIALIHEHLYHSKDLAKINFNEYIQNLTEFLFQLYEINFDAIKLKLNVDDVLLNINTAIPCGLIINELFSNALKYAFPKDRVGEIHIELHKFDDNKITLMVNDNGIGLPETLDFRNTESLGLQLVCILTQQLKGNIQLDRKGGTTFKITFTEKEY